MEKGNINWTDARIGDSALVTSENKMGVILKDYGRKFHLRFADGSEKTYDASELNFFNTDDDYKRGGSIKKGDVYQWNTVEYDSKKGNNYKVVKNIEITEIDSKGQVIGRVVGTSNQFIIRDPQKNLKSKVSKMETGGDIERGGAHMYIELKDSDIVVYHGDAFKIYKNAKPMFVISSAKKGSWDELWQSIRSIQSSNTDGQKGSAHLYVKLSNGDITVYHGDDVRQFRKLDEDERLFLQKNVRKDSWDRVYNTLMNLKSVKMENGGGIDAIQVGDYVHINQSAAKISEDLGNYVIITSVIGRNIQGKNYPYMFKVSKNKLMPHSSGKGWKVEGKINPIKPQMFDDRKMQDGGMVGQEIVFDDSGERNTGVIKEIHEITGDYIVATDDGRTVLAQKEFDVISLGKMRKQAEAKRRFSFFEDGGNIAKENKEMIDSQTIEARHHVEELSKILTKKNKIEPWVVARMERATTDLSDVTHYLEGKKMAKGGGVDGYSMNNIYRSSMRTRGNRTYIELHNSNNLSLNDSLLNKIKNLIQSYSGSAIVKALKNENGDYYFSIGNSTITKKSKEFNIQLERLMKSNKFYSADVELVKPKDGLFWSGEINEDYFDLWIYAMNIKKYIKLLNKTETISLADYNKTKEQLNKYESETFKRWNKESRDAESSGDLKKYQSNNQKRWRSEYIYERGGSMCAEGGGIHGTLKIGQFVRYKKGDDFTGGRIKTITGNKAQVHNWDGSIVELPLSDLEYVTSWNDKMTKGGGVNDVKKYEIIDSNSSKESLNNILDAIHLVNSKGLDLKLIDKTGHYAGSYNHINSVYVNSSMDFSDLVRKFNDILYSNDIYYISIIGVYAKGGSMYDDGGGVDDDFVIFSIDDDALDTLLFDNHRSEIDYEDIHGDSYYKLNRRDFDRFIDYADSIGFDVDYENNEDAVVYVVNPRMATGGGVGPKLKATYIPNRNIDELKTVFGQSIKGKDLIDGAYTTRKGIKQKPKMARTMFEEETYEFSKGGGVKNFKGDAYEYKKFDKGGDIEVINKIPEEYKKISYDDIKYLKKGENITFILYGYDEIDYNNKIDNKIFPSKHLKITGEIIRINNNSDNKYKWTIRIKNSEGQGTYFIKDVYVKTKMSTGGAVKKNGVNQFAEDEKSEGYEAKVFLGKFDGRTFKAQSTDKTWDDGTPVTKYFSRNGFKDVKLKGEYQLVDSDRGYWYVQGPRNVWYAVRHKDYGTPPFEFGKGGMMPGWKHKMAQGGGVDPTEAEAEAQKLMDELGVMVVPDPQNYGNQIRLNIYPNSNPGDRFYDGRAAQRFTVAVDNGKYLFSNGGGYRRSIQPIALLFGVEVNDNTGVAGRSSIDMSLNKKPVSLNTIRMISNYFKQGLKDESKAFSNFYKNWSNPD